MISYHALLPPIWYCCQWQGIHVAGFKFLLGMGISPDAWTLQQQCKKIFHSLKTLIKKLRLSCLTMALLPWYYCWQQGIHIAGFKSIPGPEVSPIVHTALEWSNWKNKNSLSRKFHKNVEKMMSYPFYYSLGIVVSNRISVLLASNSFWRQGYPQLDEPPYNGVIEKKMVIKIWRTCFLTPPIYLSLGIDVSDRAIILLASNSVWGDIPSCMDCPVMV